MTPRMLFFDLIDFSTISGNCVTEYIMKKIPELSNHDLSHIENIKNLCFVPSSKQESEEKKNDKEQIYKLPDGKVIKNFEFHLQKFVFFLLIFLNRK